MAMEDEEVADIKRRMLERLLAEHIQFEESGKTPPGKPITLTDATMDSAIKDYNVLVVDCWAPWCGPCRAIAPVIERLASEWKGRVAFGKLNVDENPHTAARYGIHGIPTILVFKNGALVDRIIGAMPYPALKRRLERYL